MYFAVILEDSVRTFFQIKIGRENSARDSGEGWPIASMQKSV
jgi:hypothetical protein